MSTELTTPIKIEIPGIGTIESADLYIKAEADKVIAEKDETIDELKERIDELQKATDSAWSKVNTMYDELRHNKYKRCLANAEMCMHKRWRPDEGFDYARSTRHMNKWLAIAEKFKEAK